MTPDSLSPDALEALAGSEWVVPQHIRVALLWAASEIRRLKSQRDDWITTAGTLGSEVERLEAENLRLGYVSVDRRAYDIMQEERDRLATSNTALIEALEECATEIEQGWTDNQTAVRARTVLTEHGGTGS